jgi:transposase-like protein
MEETTMSQQPFDADSLNLNRLGRMSEEEARASLEAIRWPDGPMCPHCQATKATRINGSSPNVRAGLLRCAECGKQFTVTVGTIFEDSHIPLHKWLLAIALMNSSKKGISSLQLQRNLNLGSYRTAWFMAHRIRYAMTMEPLKSLLKGTVEADETYVGGKTRQGIRGRGSERKTPVVALVERQGRVRSFPMDQVTGKNLRRVMRERVDPSSTVMTDDYSAYRTFAGGDFAKHETVNHSKGEYVRGDAHTNTAESFFALFKRGVHGTFHHVSKRHLNRYCDEFSFRWDRRKMTDANRTVEALRATEGKRLVYQTPQGGEMSA